MSGENLRALLTYSAGIKSQPNWTLVELFEYPHKSPDVKAHDPFSCGSGVLPPEMIYVLVKCVHIFCVMLDYNSIESKVKKYSIL